MSKGQVFSGPSDPAIPSDVRRRYERRLRGNPSDGERIMAEYSAELQAHNKRWTIRGLCPECSEPLIMEEIAQHRINHLPGRVRHIAQMVLDVPRSEDRAALYQLLTEVTSWAYDGAGWILGPEGTRGTA